MFFGMKRRGMRIIVQRGSPVRDRIELTLECGHVVIRTARNLRETTKSALCPTCKRTDGVTRDQAKAAAG